MKDIFRGKALTTTKHSLHEQTDDLNHERHGYCLQTLHWRNVKILCQGTTIDLLDLTSFLLGYGDSYIVFISSTGFSHNWPGPRRGSAFVREQDVI